MSRARKINPRKYGTASEVAKNVGVLRTTLAAAMVRKDPHLQIHQTVGGTLLVSVTSARQWNRQRPKRGPKSRKSR